MFRKLTKKILVIRPIFNCNLIIWIFFLLVSSLTDIWPKQNGPGIVFKMINPYGSSVMIGNENPGLIYLGWLIYHIQYLSLLKPKWKKQRYFYSFGSTDNNNRLSGNHLSKTKKQNRTNAHQMYSVVLLQQWPTKKKITFNNKI